jgi:hypothetical protein
MLSAMPTARESIKTPPAGPPSDTLRRSITLMAILCIAAFILVNVAFYFLSNSYFESHRDIIAGVGPTSSYGPAQIKHVRIAFVVFSGVVAIAGFAAGLLPRIVGHALPVLLGAVNLVAGIAAFAHELSGALTATLLVSGVLMPLLAWHSYRRSRAAWAFLVAMCAVFAVVELFGAPKVRGALDISLWITMILPGLNAVAAGALIALRGEYLESDMPATSTP